MEKSQPQEPPKDKQDKKAKEDKKDEKDEKDEKAKKDEKKKYLVLGLAIGGFVLLIITISLIFAFQKDPDITTTKIMAKLSRQIPTITDIENFSEANDPNGIMGQANQYTSKSSWEDSQIPNHTSEYAGTIEVFNNTKDAELREWQLTNSQTECSFRITAEKYGTSVKDGANCKEYLISRKNTVVIRLSSSFDESQITAYQKAIDTIIDSFTIPEKDIPSPERISELRAQHEETLSTSLDNLEKDIQKGLDEIYSSYYDKLNAIYESLNEDEFSTAKEELDFFKEASYFSPKIAALEQKINDTENKISAKKQQAQEDAARAEAAKLAQKNRRLGSGKYTACTDIDSGTYDVTAVSGSGNLFVHSDTFSHYVNELMNTTGAYGWNTEYKNLILSCGDVLELKNGLVVQLTAKR